jgi:preprotein translocase subunit SecA
MIDAILAKVFGTKNKREIKAIQPFIAAINDLEPHIQQLSDIDLAANLNALEGKGVGHC